jgi:hypothetical protein
MEDAGTCLWTFCQFYGQKVYFMAIWYVLRTLGILLPVLVCCTEKNLAALHFSSLPIGKEYLVKNSKKLTKVEPRLGGGKYFD